MIPLLLPYRALAGLLILCLGLLAANSNSTQNELPQYSRDVWDGSRGYPSGRIYGMTQTRDGYLWIGTDRGLIRFDGLAFQIFQQIGPDRAPIGSVFALAGDPQGNLLISTLSGLQRLRLRNEELEELPRLSDQPADPLSAIYQEHNGTILIATVRRGMIAYDGKNFRALPGPHINVTAAVQARDGTLWMGTATQGLFAYPNRRILDQPEDLHHVRINALLPFGKHGLTVGTEKGLLRWDGTNVPGRLSGPPHIQVMMEDRRGNLWLGSTQGLYRIGSDSVTPSIIQYSRDIVTSLYEDREGDVWAGTSTGIVRSRQRILTTYALTPDAGESSGTLFADDKGAVWYATPQLGLARIVEGRTERILASAGYTSLAGAGSDLWLGQKDGTVWRVKQAPSKLSVFSRKEVQLRQPIIALFKSRDGPLWVGMHNAGIAEIADGRTTLYSKVAGFVLNTVTAIEQSRDGVMWFATASGLASLSQGHWRSYTARDGVPPGRINSIFADRAGVLWVGADQGLAYIAKGTAHLTASSLPLLHEPIFGIVADRDDFLWVLTSSHVFRVKRAELLNGDPGSILVRQFGGDDGMPAVSPSRGSRSVVTDPGGRIWISLGNTLVMADPLELRRPSPPTLVHFQQVMADELPLRLGRTVLVPAGHLRTVIRFAGLNLAAPDRVRFRYRLDEFDPAWSDVTSMREATYTNLGPGPYHFEVQASNIDGLWNGPPSTINLYVEPTLSQTLWFRFSAILAICAIGLMAYRLRLQTIKRQWTLRFHERLEERNRIARELHDTLLQSFHGLILRFQAVRDMLPEQPDAANEALGFAIDRAADAVAEGREAVQALRGEQDGLDELGESLATLDSEFRTETAGTQHGDVHTAYRVVVEGRPRRLHPVVRDDLYRIAREAVGNSFRHASAKQVELEIQYDDAAVRLRVRDDGVGMDLQVLRSGRRKGHYGLPGMRERATSIGGQFELWSELNRGTEIQVTIPSSVAYARFDNSESGAPPQELIH